jgi:hypothetical protein
MATDAFVTRVKTELNITHNYFDAKLKDLIDEALFHINQFKVTAITEATADFMNKRAIYLYVSIKLDNRTDLEDAWKQQVEYIREK